MAQEHLRLDPFSGAVLVFLVKRTDQLKILPWDGSGMALIVKRLEDVKFNCPTIRDGVVRLSSGQQAVLFEGLDRRWVHARRAPWRRRRH